MTGSTSHAAGEGAILCLDPAALPLRYRMQDSRADGQERIIELSHDRVVVHRHIGGLAMKVQVPMSAFRGVSVRFVAQAGNVESLGIVLEHDDPDLCVPLHLEDINNDIIERWQLWSQVLARPLLVLDPEGRESVFHSWLGPVCVRDAIARRRRHSSLAGRRPKALMRRKNGHSRPTQVHREVEIVAWNAAV